MGRIDKAIDLLALESPSPIGKQGSRWQLTVVRLSENQQGQHLGRRCGAIEQAASRAGLYTHDRGGECGSRSAGEQRRIALARAEITGRTV